MNWTGIWNQYNQVELSYIYGSWDRDYNFSSALKFGLLVI